MKKKSDKQSSDIFHRMLKKLSLSRYGSAFDSAASPDGRWGFILGPFLEKTDIARSKCENGDSLGSASELGFGIPSRL